METKAEKAGQTQTDGGIRIRAMQPTDYDKVRKLWLTIHRLGIRSVDDAKEGVLRFLERNPETSVVAERGGEIVGSILCGHDGRTGCFYHVCVREDLRRRGIGSRMVRFAVDALTRERISKISLFAYTDNSLGNDFWKCLGFVRREDMYNYEWQLNAENVTSFNQ